MDAPVPVYLTVDIVVLAGSNEYQILLIQRKNPPYQHMWALPGGFVDPGEDLETAARRELHEETNIRTSAGFVQVGAFGKPDRDPRGRTVSVAYLVTVPAEEAFHAGSDAERAQWFPLNNLPELAFDHHQIISCALEKTDI